MSRAPSTAVRRRNGVRTDSKRSRKPIAPAGKPADCQPGERFDALPEHEAILVEHDLISPDDLEILAPQARAGGATVFDLLIELGLYSAAQLELCLSTHAWLARSTTQQLEHITSEESLSRCRHEYALNACFTIPHFLSREELTALDLALHRISLAHVDADPQRHKVYHSIGGNLLFSQQAVVGLISHPALLAIARAFLGDALVAGKPYLKVDDPYAYRGMFGHTHAETHYDCLARGLYMFLYMDATGHECGAFQILPGSHARYQPDAHGRTLFDGKPLEAQSSITNKASLTHDADLARRWAGYESLNMPGNTLVVLSPFLWHAVRPVMHRRRLMFLGYFDARALTREFVLSSDYFGPAPYDLSACDLRLLNKQQHDLMAIHLDREAWLAAHNLGWSRR
jgi:hypothetical protein